MGVTRFNTEPTEELTAELLACCEVPSWVTAVREGRPYTSTVALLEAADTAARAFTAADVDRALAAHPRIGERAEGTGVGAVRSRQEQSGVQRDPHTLAALREANQAYEERFGRVFLISASGLTSEQILAAARARLGNDDETEVRVVADELRKIALQRLRGLVES